MRRCQTCMNAHLRNGSEGRGRKSRQALGCSGRGERERAHDDPPGELDLEGIVAGGRGIGERSLGGAAEGGLVRDCACQQLLCGPARARA